MLSSRFTHADTTLRAEPLNDAEGPLRLVFAHGWGLHRESMRPLAERFLTSGEVWLVDLPGFGEAPLPSRALSPADYAELLAAWLAGLPPCPTVLIGHSFGFRVGLYLAANHSQQVRALVGIGGAGIPKPLNPKQFARQRSIRLLMTLGKLIKPVVGEAPLNQLRQQFGSADYLSAPPALKPTFLRVVNDDATPVCGRITQPTLLIYGENDTATPPAMGKKFNQLIKNSLLHVLPHQTHNGLLQGGRHVVEKHLRAFLSSLG